MVNRCLTECIFQHGSGRTIRDENISCVECLIVETPPVASPWRKLREGLRSPPLRNGIHLCLFIYFCPRDGSWRRALLPVFYGSGNHYILIYATLVPFLSAKRYTPKYSPFIDLSLWSSPLSITNLDYITENAWD